MVPPPDEPPPPNVPEDAVAHIYDDLGDAALQMMRRNMGARLVTTDDCLT